MTWMIAWMKFTIHRNRNQTCRHPIARFFPLTGFVWKVNYIKPVIIIMLKNLSLNMTFFNVTLLCLLYSSHCSVFHSIIFLNSIFFELLSFISLLFTLRSHLPFFLTIFHTSFSLFLLIPGLANVPPPSSAQNTHTHTPLRNCTVEYLRRHTLVLTQTHSTQFRQLVGVWLIDYYPEGLALLMSETGQVPQTTGSRGKIDVSLFF